MIQKFFETPQYAKVMTKHLTEMISLLFNQNQEFAIACEIKHIKFNPELPSQVKESFQDVVLFVMAGYTFESAILKDDFFIFEAGFGEENFGSTITVPLLAIKQLFVEETPLLLNLSEPQIIKKPSTKLSMEALLKNPENKKLVKRRKNK